MSFVGKLQVVTGGTSGMGLDNARALGEFGPVLIGGRNEKRLENALAYLKEQGVEAYGKTCDVGDRESVEAFRDYALTLGEVGSVINAAGIDWEGVSTESIIKVNMGGTINVTEAFYPHMAEGGIVVNYSSITGYGYQPNANDIAAWNEPNDPDFAAKAHAAIVRPERMPSSLGESYPYYAASKRFVMHYTQANAARFGAKGMRIFSIAPGSFDTPMLRNDTNNLEQIKEGTAFKRFGTPAEMSDLIISLMRPGHDYFTGCDVVMDGGKWAMATVKQLA